jgi:hypothetical protein
VKNPAFWKQCPTCKAELREEVPVCSGMSSGASSVSRGFGVSSVRWASVQECQAVKGWSAVPAAAPARSQNLPALPIWNVDASTAAIAISYNDCLRICTAGIRLVEVCVVFQLCAMGNSALQDFYGGGRVGS